MRLLLSSSSKRKLLLYLKNKNNVTSLRELSKGLNIPKSTLDGWFYDSKKYIPLNLIPKDVVNSLDILDKQHENWGQVKGGKKTYKVLLKRYGIKEIHRRQKKGATVSAKRRRVDTGPFILNISDSLFLEFYGILLGDGWISNYKYKNKRFWIIGISGHSRLDKDFFVYCKKNVKDLFNRGAYLKELKGQNSIQLVFSHKQFLKTLNKEIGFPIGKKINLQISKKILKLGFDSVKHVIRGIFDTDGSFYLDKTPVGNPYPCISIQMNSPILIKQLNDALIQNGFKVLYRKNKNMITLKGGIQLKKWMKDIGSSNSKHLNKINALVAQSG